MTIYNENFPFAEDLNPVTAQIPSGTDPIKKFLFALEAKGVSICDDLQVTDGDIFLKDGTNLRGVVKDLAFEYQYVKADGSFVAGTVGVEILQDVGTVELPGDGSFSEAAGGAALTRKTYLKISRPNGQVVYKEADGINRLEYQLDNDSVVESIAEAVEKINELSAQVTIAIAAEGSARSTDTEVLESSFDVFLTDLSAHLTSLEGELYQYADRRDLDGITDGMQKITLRRDMWIGEADADAVRVEVDYSVVAAATATGGSEIKVVGSLPPQMLGLIGGVVTRSEIKHWAIKAALVTEDRSGASPVFVKMENESIWHTASIALNAGTGNHDLSVTLKAADCGGMPAGSKIVISAAYAGPYGVGFDPASAEVPATPVAYGGQVFSPVFDPTTQSVILSDSDTSPQQSKILDPLAVSATPPGAPVGYSGSPVVYAMGTSGFYVSGPDQKIQLFHSESAQTHIDFLASTYGSDPATVSGVSGSIRSQTGGVDSWYYFTLTTHSGGSSMVEYSFTIDGDSPSTASALASDYSNKEVIFYP